MISAFSLRYQDQTYAVNPAEPVDISLPLEASADAVNCFWAEPARFDVIQVGDFIGSVAQGGSTNYLRVHLTPHGNGTHTECYGHISADPEATINKCLQQFFFVARLVSLPLHTQENGDLVVLLEDVRQALEQEPMPEALVIRTLPNTSAKRTNQYSGTNPPYLQPGIGELLAEKGIQHLLLDLPSVDREMDEGKLANHHQFWQYPDNTRKNATITELIFVPETAPDGLYLLNLQIASLEIDASPSKPVLYTLTKEHAPEEQVMKLEEIIEEQQQADKPTTVKELLQPFRKTTETTEALPEAEG